MAPRTTPPFRADHVGSLLRPQKLLDARDKRKAGTITAEQFARSRTRRSATRSSCRRSSGSRRSPTASSAAPSGTSISSRASPTSP